MIYRVFHRGVKGSIGCVNEVICRLQRTNPCKSNANFLRYARASISLLSKGRVITKRDSLKLCATSTFLESTR
jgi:hypothetical protein